MGLVLFLQVFSMGAAVVGFGWWLCGVLSLFTAVRERGGRETKIRERRYIILVNVGKFRPQLIELTSFKPKLLIRFITNKTC